MQVPRFSPFNNTAPLPFTHTSEDLEGAIASYYDVQSLTARGFLWPLARKSASPGFEWLAWPKLFYDHHPNNVGHRLMAELAVHLIQETALGLAHRPISPEEEALRQEALPEPMFPGNFAPRSATCVAGEGLRALVQSADRFYWVNEGSLEKPKWGYVGVTPGSSLTLALDTHRPFMSPDELVPVMIQYLSSYEHMGVAMVECVSGCACAPEVVNARSHGQTSQNVLTRFTASQSTECLVRITILNTTSTGEYKFKVSGVVVAESILSAYEFDYVVSDQRFWQEKGVGKSQW